MSTQHHTFQNTIKSDSPPLDTFSLTRIPDDPSDAIDHDYSSIVLPDIEDDTDDGKNIISITTDSSYKSTSEYAEARKPNNHADGHNIDYRHQSLTSLFPSVSTRLPHSGEHRLPASTPSTQLQVTSTSTGAPDDLFGSLFGFLFKDDQQLAEFQSFDETSTTTMQTTTSTEIPPFRKITTLVSLNDLLNLTQQQQQQQHSTWPASYSKPTTDNIPQRINDKVFESATDSTSAEYPTDWSTASLFTPESQESTSLGPSSTSTEATSDPFQSETSTTAAQELSDLHILRDALLGSLGNSDSATLPVPSRHPIYQGSVPFLSPIFQARPANVESKHNQHHHQFGEHEHYPIRSDLDLILSALPKAGQTTGAAAAAYHAAAGGAALPEYSSVVPSRRQEYVVHNGVLSVDPVVQSTVQTFDGGAAQIFTKPSPANVAGSSSSVGLLKLAGCNIYGRMYRVGRIISELSSECLECRCTEVGVNCTPLEC